MMGVGVIKKVVRPRRNRQSSQGFSLVELLVAIALGLFLTGGVVTVFVGSRESFSTQSGLSQMQQSARFAMDLITAEVRMAGFMGCYSDQSDVFNALNPASDDTFPPEYDVTTAIIGHEAISDSAWSPALNTLPGDVASNAVGGTDVLIVRRGGDASARIVEAMPLPAATLKIQPNLDPPPFEPDDVLMISDCTKSAVFQAANYQDSSGTVVRNEGTGTPGNHTKDLSDGEGFDTDATVFKVETRFFFVGDAAGVNNDGNAYQSLFVQVADDPAVELVPGIENLQVLYGEDISGNGVPDRFVTANNVSDFAAVYSAKIAVTATSIDSVGDEGDGILRQEFQATVKLRNRGINDD